MKKAPIKSKPGKVLAALMMLTASLLTAQSDDSALRARIASALSHDLQLDMPAGQLRASLRLLTPADNDSPRGELTVTTVQPSAQQGWWITRLECLPRSACLPFYVLLSSQLDPCRRTTAACGTSGGSSSLPSAASALQASGQPTLGVAVRRGEKVTLVEDRSGMHLSAKAACLQSGGPGQAIRVRNLNSKRVVLATVVGPGLVSIN